MHLEADIVAGITGGVDPIAGGSHRGSMTPEVVADVVVESIDVDRSRILPHEHVDEQSVDNARRRIDGSPPVLPTVR